MRGLAGILIILVAIIVIVMQSLFVVTEVQKAIVTRFGAIEHTIEDPGLNFKVPFIDQVYRYDDRLLTLDSEEFPVTFSDNRRFVVDAFSRWRISDVKTYHLAVRRGDARSDLAGILEKALRGVLGTSPTDAILSADRTRLTNDILTATRAPAADLGVEVVDVRIVRADLPDNNLQATFDRMSAERQQEAADERARGAEAARRITAAAERQATQIVSEAQRDAEIIKGEADAERNRIFAEAFSANQEFFDFYRSLEAYRKSLSGSNTSIVLSPDDDFFRFLQNETGTTN